MQSEIPRTSPTGPRVVRLVCLLLALITVVLYWPVKGFEFNNYDDAQYLTDNPSVQNGLTVPAIKWAFTSGYASNWHPLTWLSHLLDVSLFGFNPGGHHLTNLLFHVANTLLLFLWLRRWTGALWRSAFVAALFAWHPLHVESVAWVAERKDVLSTFFWLLTLLAYGKYAAVSRDASRKTTGAGRYYLLALGLFALGLMAKPMLVSLPLILLLLDYWPLGRMPIPFAMGNAFRLLREKIPFFLVSAASCAITFLVQKKGEAVQSLENLSLADRLANAIVSYARYLGKLFWPTDLAILYPFTRHLPMVEVLAAVVLLLVICAVVARLAKSHPWLPVGWLWFLITLVPVIGLVQVGEQAIADRYTYIPSIGLFLLVAWEVPRLLTGRLKTPVFAGAEVTRLKFIGLLREKLETRHLVSYLFNGLKAGWRRFAPLPASSAEDKMVGAMPSRCRIPLALAAALILGGCVLATAQQLRYWQNSITLFTRAIQVSKNNPIAESNLGLAFAAEGKTTEAIAHERAALEINPNDAVAENNLGMMLNSQGQGEEAMAHLRAALKDRPRYDQPHYNLGLIYLRQGRLDEAIKEFRAAIAINPNYDKAFANLGMALAQQGHLDEASEQYRKALALAPNNSYAHNALGRALEAGNELNEAAAQYSAAIASKPDFAEAHENLGVVSTMQGKFPQAEAEFALALKLQPGAASAHCGLGNALLRENKFAAAVEEYSEAVRLQPGYVEANFNLALALIKLGRTADASKYYRAVLRLKPQDVGALQKLAWLLATDPNPQLRNAPEAVRLATEATGLAPGNATVWDTQAAALAESGRYTEAVTAAAKALDLATANQSLAKEIQNRLRLYQSGAPFHERGRKQAN